MKTNGSSTELQDENGHNDGTTTTTDDAPKSHLSDNDEDKMEDRFDCQQQQEQDEETSSLPTLPLPTISMIAAQQFVHESVVEDVLFSSRNKFTELDCNNWAFYYDMLRDQIQT